MQFVHALHQILEGFEFGDLTADVKVDSHVFHCGQLLGTTYGREHVFHGQTKLIFIESGCNLRMGVCIYVGVDAKSHVGDFALGGCEFIDHFQFRKTLDIETTNA